MNRGAIKCFEAICNAYLLFLPFVPQRHPPPKPEESISASPATPSPGSRRTRLPLGGPLPRLLLGPCHPLAMYLYPFQPARHSHPLQALLLLPGGWGPASSGPDSSAGPSTPQHQPRPAPQLTSVSAILPLNANITWHTLLHLCPEPQVPTVYRRAASSRKSSYQSLPPQTPPALNHLRLDNLLLSSVLFFSPLFWWEGPKWYHRTALNANPGSLSCR